MMISLPLARQLKEAGLVWRAGVHDFFAIPDRDLDDRVFVITDVMAYLELFRGWPVVTFHGTVEWALDYILTSEVVWMPTEEQLRQELEDVLRRETESIMLQLTLDEDDYRCHLAHQDKQLTFTGATASEAYGQAMLYVLRHTPEP